MMEMCKKNLVLVCFVLIVILIVPACNSVGTMKKNNQSAGYTEVSEEAFSADIVINESMNITGVFDDRILIGVDEEGIYHENILGQEITIYRTGYGSNASVPKEIYHITGASYEVFHEIINGKLYIGYLREADGYFGELIIEEISTNGDGKRIYSANICAGPDLIFCTDAIIITYDTHTGNQIEVLSLGNYEITVAKETKHKMTEEGIITGEWILRSGTFDNHGFYYEIGHFENETQLEGEIKLYYYDFVLKKTRYVMDCEKMSMYVSGDKDENIVINQYEIQNPDLTTGKILYKENSGFVQTEIDGIEPGKKILNTYKIEEDYLIVIGGGCFHIFDLNEKTWCKKYISGYEEGFFCVGCKTKRRFFLLFKIS